MSKTVVGLFSTIERAQSIKQAMIADGYPSQHIAVVANDDDSTSLTGGTTENGGTEENGGTSLGIGQKISNFFHSLTGGDQDVHEHYATGVNQGGGLLAVTCDDEEANEVAAVLMQHGARDIDGDYDDAVDSDVPVYGGVAANTTDGQTAIPIVEEELVVGKREVDRGGVRVYSHVVAVPVETDVTLRDERIHIERRPVDRVATAADFEAGRGSVIELTATGEEAVIGKTSRVVEEVLVGKNTSSRTEAIHESVRKTEVEVEEIPTTEEVRSSRY